MFRILFLIVYIFIALVSKAQETNILVPADTTHPKPSTSDTSFYNTLLLESAYEGNLDQVYQALLKGANVNTHTNEGVTALMYASQNGFLDIVNILIEYQAEVNTKPNDGATALIAACRFNNYEIMNTLVLAGADINTKDNEGLSALTIAAAYNYFIPADLLIFYGADVNSQTSDSITPLFIACMTGSYDVAELLVKHGADVNFTDTKSWTPLIASVYTNNFSLTKLLLENGAEINKINFEGYSPLAISIYNNNADIAKLLLNNGAATDISINKLSLRKLSLFYNAYKIYHLLDSVSKKKELLPFFDHLNVAATEISLNNKDFMWGSFASVRDKRYNLTFGLGFNTRFWPNRILVDYGNDTFYQFRERRSIAYVSVEKLFPFFRDGNVEKSVFIDFREVYTYGKYRASNTKPEQKFLFYPSLGYCFSNESIGFKAALGYLKTGVLKENPLRISASFFFKIPLLYQPTLNKTINWL